MIAPAAPAPAAAAAPVVVEEAVAIVVAIRQFELLNTRLDDYARTQKNLSKAPTDVAII